MLGISSLKGRYSLVASDLEEDVENKAPQQAHDSHKSNTKRFLPFVIAAILICLIVGYTIGTQLERWTVSGSGAASTINSPCNQPRFRREWRSLSLHEKHGYLQAVQCLKKTPSRLGLNQSLYDDFPYVHFHVGGYSHGAAAFLAWHRYFLHTYHRALREECRFTGELTYWNWALDWQNIADSPIWNPDVGFGGDGNPEVGNTIVKGHCVTDGPFAHFEIPYLDAVYRPHCLSRGFENGSELAKHGTWFNPAALETLLGVDDYEAFNLGLEDGPHIAIPRSIRGDFSLLTAPSGVYKCTDSGGYLDIADWDQDPVFFLHHGQLDRLWWTWQGMNGRKRRRMYSGKRSHNSSKDASLDDVIPMGGLAPDTTVASIIDTESGLLCYSYL